MTTLNDYESIHLGLLGSIHANSIHF